MDETVLKAAFAPLVTVIVTQGVQTLVELIKPASHQRKWLRTMTVTTAVAIVVSAFAFAMISNATHCAISNLGWQPYSSAGLGSTIEVTPVPGSKCAFQISFDLKEQGGPVAIYQKLEQRFLAWWIKGIEFSYRGRGNPNTMEFKLFDTADSGYGVVLGQIINVDDKISSREVPYDSLRASTTGAIFKRDGFKLDRMDFTFSSRPNDTPGTGQVTILDIRIVPVWQVWLLVLGPVLLLVGSVGLYSIWQERRRKGQPLEPKQKQQGATRKATRNTTERPKRKRDAAPNPSKSKKRKN